MSKKNTVITPQTQEFIDKINALKIGHATDWKFGLVTRDVCRISSKRFEISDTSHGWLSVVVSDKVMLQLLTGEKSLNDLDWE